MRIAFLWKWWSWKSTTSTSFARYLFKSWKNTIFADADINVNWLQILWFNLENFPYLSENQSKINDYTFWKRKDVSKDKYLWITPVSELSNLYRFDSNEIQNITQKNSDGLVAMWIWAYNENEIWFTCYHWKSDSFVWFLNHLLDDKDDYLVVDSVTGIDNTGTPLAYSYHLNVLVVEPTKKSIWVCTDFKIALDKNNISSNICVIWNKIESKEDEEFIKENIWDIKYLWSLSFSESMKDFDQWDKESFDKFVMENSNLYDSILEYAHSLEFDWNIYYSYMYSYFDKMCQDYYNDYFKIKLQEWVIEKLDYKTLRENELSKY